MSKIKKFERQQAIENIAKGRKYVQISDVTKELLVSESTIRRDIEEMENKGLLIRSQGSIIWNDRTSEYLENVYYRQDQNINTKKQLAIPAAQLIEPNDILFIDTGTTMMELAKNISDDMNITVVTNDIQVALILENKFNVSTLILGGFVKRGTHTVIGSMAERNLEGIYFQKVFLSPGGITEEGFTFYNMQAMDVRLKVVNNAQQVIMVADSTKFGKRGFTFGFPFEKCNVLVTDFKDEDWIRKLSSDMKIISCIDK